MCSPKVMAAVNAELTRRGALGAAAAALAAGAFGVRGHAAAARQDGLSLGSYTKILDLSHTISADTPMFPGAAAPIIEETVNVADDGYFGNTYTFWEHTGTHMDAPAHFIADGAFAEDIPVERLVAPLAILDISEKAAKDPDAQVTPDDLVAWEKANGQFPAGAFVAMNSGWAAKIGDPKAYINLDGSDVQHYPGFHPDAATWLVEERDIVGIGVDTLSQDFGASTDFATHVVILGAGKYGIENLANLGELPAAGGLVIIGGPKHAKASGGPSRVLAFY